MPSEPVIATRIWVGGYTPEMDGTGEGIGLLAVGDAGELSYLGTARVTASPSFLARSGDVIYAAGESGPTVSAFRRDGVQLTPLGEQPAAGDFPCALAVIDSSLIVASYGDGAIGVHPITASGAIEPLQQALHSGSGSGDAAPTPPQPAHTAQDPAHTALNPAPTGPHPAQDGPHAHDVLRVDATTVLTTDLGTDSVFVHELGTDGRLTRTGAVQLAPGTGPRDLLLRPSGDVWVLGELASTLVVLRPQAGGYAVIDTVPLPGAETGDHASAIAVTRSGSHVYIGLRGSNRIAVLWVAGKKPEPVTSVPCGGDWPRHLVVAGEHLYVANQRSSTVATFAIAEDGALVAQGTTAVPSPTYLLVD